VRGGRLRDPDLLATAALGCVYLAVFSGHGYSIDGLLMYRQAVSIVHDHSLRFSTPIWWGDTFATSKYGIGLSLLYLPGVVILSLFSSPPVPNGPGSYDWALFYQDFIYRLSGAPIHLLIGLATAFLVARLARELGGGQLTALLALFAYGIASPAIVYARGDFSQPLLGLCLTAGLLAAVRYRRSGVAGALAAMAASLVLGVLTRPVEGSFLLPALLLLVGMPTSPGGAERRRVAAMAWIAAAYLLALAITGLVNWGRTGSPLETGYGGGWTTALWIGVPGLLLSPGRSIILAFPMLLLAPLGLRRLLATEHRLAALAIGGVVLALLLNNALWSQWWGSWSWGPRLLVPALPLLAVPAAIGAVSLRPALRGWLPALLLLGGVVWAIPGSFTDLLTGYGAAHDSAGRSWALTAYPPLWALVHGGVVDILWIRLARSSGYLSLLVPAVLLGLVCYLAILVRRAAAALPPPVRSSG
jgi:hypothetical protein